MLELIHKQDIKIDIFYALHAYGRQLNQHSALFMSKLLMGGAGY
ncbi:MAG: hypothetical protein ACTS7E_00955 [Arsenophonus sp. NC-CH8-MAG3]